MWDFFKTLTDPQSIIQYGGIVLLALVIFSETGLFFGFFLPGDNLVLLSGILCHTHPDWLGLDFLPMALLLTLSATAGNFAGYGFGYITGKALFKKSETRFFKPRHLQMAQHYYETYGGSQALIIARFIPVIRTFAPILAGGFKVPFLKFSILNFLSATVWIFSLSGIGYLAVQWFPEITQYMHWVFLFLILLTALPVIRIAIKSRR